MPKRANSSKKSMPKQTSEQTFSRHELVGKFPHIRHQPAPRAKRYMLTEDQRNALVAKMLLY